MIAHIIVEMFAWPQGIVVGNLIASAITSSIVAMRNEVHHKRTQRLLAERNSSNGTYPAGTGTS